MQRAVRRYRSGVRTVLPEKLRRGLRYYSGHWANHKDPHHQCVLQNCQGLQKILPGFNRDIRGAHASFIPMESLDKPYVDCVCIGEGEKTLEEVLQNKPFHTIDGLAYKKKTEGGFEMVKTPTRKRIKDLDELPYPAYDMVDLSVYRPIIGNFKRLPAMMIVSSRGCPWSCNFCRRSVGRMWTYKSARALYDEIKYLATHHGIRDIAIMDDVFTVNKERVFEFCDLLIENPLDIQWKCFARVDIVTEEMLFKMKQAGCWGIMYGVENFDPEVLTGLNKGVELQQIYNAVQWAKNADIEVRVCMMVGNVGDTEEILDRNIQLLIDLDPDYLALAILTPFPGHAIYNWGVREDRIMTYDWDQYYGSTPILQIDTMTPEQTYKMFKKMARKFYFRPRYIWKRLRRIKSFSELRYNVVGFFGLLMFYLDKFKPSEIYGKRKDRNKDFATSMMQDKCSTEINKEKAVEYTLAATKETATT